MKQTKKRSLNFRQNQTKSRTRIPKVRQIKLRHLKVRQIKVQQLKLRQLYHRHPTQTTVRRAIQNQNFDRRRFTFQTRIFPTPEMTKPETQSRTANVKKLKMRVRVRQVESGWSNNPEFVKIQAADRPNRKLIRPNF